MKLVDMERPKRSKKEIESVAIPQMEEERYPYGLRLCFESEDIEKLPALADMEADDVVVIEGRGYVKSVSVDDVSGEGRSRHRVEIQLEEVGVESEKAPEDMDAAEYAAWRKGKRG